MTATATMQTAGALIRPLDDDALRTLFERARSGDGRALEQLCAHMRPRLFRTALAVVRDADEADDIAQEALVRSVTRRFLFLGRGSVGGWMTRIALNLARDKRRDEGRRREILEAAVPNDVEARGAVATAVRDAPSLMLDRERRALLEQTLAALPRRQRDVVRLRLLAQLSFAEIAAALSMTEANARVTYSQAHRRLMAFLDDGASRE